MPAPAITPKQIAQLTDWIADYIADQRTKFHKRAQPISADTLEALRPFFSEDILSGVRLVRGRASEPAFYSQLKTLGIENAPPFADMAGITFQDVVVHVEPLTRPLLFHELAGC